MPLFEIVPKKHKLNFQDWVDNGFETNTLSPDPVLCPICNSPNSTCGGQQNGSASNRQPARSPAWSNEPIAAAGSGSEGGSADA